MTDQAMLERLEALVLLSVPPMPKTDRETDETRVLALCDYGHTRDQIAKTIGKSLNRVDVLLNALRKDGKIRSVSKDSSTVYVRLRR